MFNQYQKGLSPVGVLFNICVFAFVILVGSKVIEHYIDYNTIRSVFTDVSDQPKAAEKSPDALKREIESALVINSIREWNFKDNAYFTNEKGEKVLGFAYEIREHLFSNIDIVLSFNFEKVL